MRHHADAGIMGGRRERGGDLRALMEVLAPDVTLWTDGGGVGPAVSLRPVHGRDRVAAVFMAVARALPSEGLVLKYRRVAQDSCALLFAEDGPLAALVVDLAPGGDRIVSVFSVTHPGKLSGVGPGHRASPAPGPEGRAPSARRIPSGRAVVDR
ncbi:hypothetical protein ACFVIM_08440 [Streptomyces sp. NPDC057638]|uniref:hypothetical protein n=1 Tax=Streptomyces sp. NPDC057638 TaxID=3346190 RepID=UPI0036AF020A